jgi:hypothetical protein
MAPSECLSAGGLLHPFGGSRLPLAEDQYRGGLMWSASRNSGCRVQPDRECRAFHLLSIDARYRDIGSPVLEVRLRAGAYDHPPEGRLLQTYGPQEAGRSLGFPVHWPLWPAPLPPLVGGGALANDGAATASISPPVRQSAVTLRRMQLPPS